MSLSDDESEEKEIKGFITVVDLGLNKQRNETQIRLRVKEYVEKIVSNYTSEEFKIHFSGKKPIPAQKQLLLALWMMATPDSYRSVCVKFDVGKATAIRIMRRVTYALHTLAPRFIQWPQDERATKVMEEFEKVSGFPKIIGAIDGTHFKIIAPQEDKQSYVICIQKLLFTSVLAGNVGSVYDARVFRLSSVREYIENPLIYFPNDSHIVGDAAYSIHPHIMVPFKDNGHLTARQKNFNLCHSSVRTSIERAIGLWKIRWRSILDCLAMVTIEKIPEYLVATYVLHNICILKGDLIDLNQVYEEDTSYGTLISNRVEDSNVKRQRIMNNLTMRVI
ncbi:PREDICTED: uncharacterized protein LOC108773542 [Cyphomyrmex costatus]|uniref:uncharacterized protein LOC108773542 n=1 Tax=Cyphomyrmex costatus TaxID=456900 RepID=UPI00085237DA|nr:PREDICTED: uncharacterized protein LOC108773542 [Cyphomyrmex costatus]